MRTTRVFPDSRDEQGEPGFGSTTEVNHFKVGSHPRSGSIFMHTINLY